MTRPRCCYRIQYCQQARYFMPDAGQACQWDAVDLSAEELEALRLKNIAGMDQTRAATEMEISQSSFQRLLTSAYKKVTEALLEGKPIRVLGIEKNKLTVETRKH